MGKIDTLTKEYMSNPDIFADAFNKYLYHGKQIILPNQLQELDPTEIVVPYGDDGAGVPEQKYRDVIKVAKTDGEVAYCILGIENQSDVHYAMPVRNGVYDFLQLAHQVNEAARSHRKKAGGGEPEEYRPSSEEFLSGFYATDRLLTVITLVVCFSPDKWSAPLSLREMYAIQDEKIISCAADYRVNLITPEELEKEDFDEFHTSLREVLLYIKYSKNKGELGRVVESDDRFQSVERQVAELINTVTNSKIPYSEREETVNMCQAIKEMREESKLEGRIEGRREGKLEGMIRAYLDMELSLDDIAEKVNLPVSKVEEIIASFEK